MNKKIDTSRGRWVQIWHDVLHSPAFTELGYSARSLYLDLRMLLTGVNNGNLSATLSTLRHRGWTSPTTLAKNLRELEAVGLIAKTRKTVGVERGSKVCNLYRFTDEACYENIRLDIPMMKATKDYARIKSRAEARALLRSARAPSREKRDATQAGETATGTVRAPAANDAEVVIVQAANL